MSPRPPKIPELTRLDACVARFLVRYPGARVDALVAATGASPDGIRKSLRRLTAHRMVQRLQRQIDLRGADNQIRETTAGVWCVTKRGARLAGTWRTPGSGMQVSLEAGGVARNLADHMAGVAGLAAWYGQWFEVGSEREVLSLERPSNLGGGLVKTQLASYWSVRIPGQPG